jgi:Phage gp6-like head-tail connector protein
MAANDLTTLADVKQYANVTTATDDALLTRMITAASAFIQIYINRTFMQQSYTDVIDGFGGKQVQTQNYPIQSVSSVTVDGLVIPAAPAAALRVSGWQGYVFDNFQISLQGYCFTNGFQNIVIAYTAGYAVIPFDIAQACIEMISLRYKERDRIGFVSKSIGGEMVTFSVKDMPASTATLLLQYRRVAPFA